MFRRVAAACVLALSAAVAAADPGPTLLTVFPPGAKAGAAVEVTLSGTGFDGVESLLFSDPKVKAELVAGSVAADPKAKDGGGRRKGGQAAASVKFKVTVPPGAAEGTLDVRVVGKAGLSNPRAFVVGKLAEANEAEPNNDVPQAQKVELNTTVNGAISSPTDVDYVAVKVKAGQNVVVVCLATSIDSKLQADLMVATLDGKPIAANHGYRDGDAVLDFLAPADGEYLVRVSQFAYTTGGPDHFYRLTVTTGPWTDAVFPPVALYERWTHHGRNIGPRDKSGRYTGSRNVPPGTLMPGDQTGRLRATRVIPPSAGMIDAIDDSAGSQDGQLLLVSQKSVVLDNEKNHTADVAQPIVVPCDVAGRVEKKGARHWYSFAAKKGDVWTLEVFADRLGSPVDAYFVLTDEKGKVIVEQDDGPDSLSPNQFYTKTDDPGRYKFTAPADGTYRVMVSTREAVAQFGVRDQYVLRIAKEKPDFRLAVLPVGTHYPDAGTVAKGGAVLFAVYVFRFDGFDGPITLSAEGLPKGVTCPPQVVGPGQTRGTLVLTADAGAADWAGFVTIKGTATAGGQKLETLARPFSVVWSFPGVNPGQPAPNSPVLTRMDRGAGLALAVRGEAPFVLAAADKGPLKATAGSKVEVTLKVTRKGGFKDAVQVFAATPGVGPRQQGNNPPPALGTIAADRSEVKVSVDVPANLPPGAHSLVFRGQAGAAPPKGNNNQRPLVPSYPAVPVALQVEGKAGKK